MRDKYRFKAILGGAIPQGPQGQPAHEDGATILVIHRVHLAEVGNVSMTVARPSSCLLNAAEAHVKRGARLRTQLPKQMGGGGWIQPGHELRFTNEDLVYDYLSEAMAAVLLMYTALDGFANENLPADVVATDSKGNKTDRAQIEGYWSLQKRLDLILPQVIGKPSFRIEHPGAWADLTKLKELRDDIGHQHLEDYFSRPEDDPSENAFSRLLAADLKGFLASVDFAIEYYTPPPFVVTVNVEG
jgi:hypothetical protein